MLSSAKFSFFLVKVFNFFWSSFFCCATLTFPRLCTFPLTLFCDLGLFELLSLTPVAYQHLKHTRFFGVKQFCRLSLFRVLVGCPCCQTLQQNLSAATNVRVCSQIYRKYLVQQFFLITFQISDNTTWILVHTNDDIFLSGVFSNATTVVSAC